MFEEYLNKDSNLKLKFHYKKLEVMILLISSQYDRLKSLIPLLTQLNDLFLQDQVGEENRVWLCVVLNLTQTMVKNKKDYFKNFRNIAYRSSKLNKNADDDYPENIYENVLLATLSM